MKDYGKNAKTIYFAFGILSFLTIVVSLIYMNQYTNLWFYETVGGITSNDSSVASSSSNSSFFAFLNVSDNFNNFSTYFNDYFKSIDSSVNLVGAEAGRICLSVYRGLNSVNTAILWLGLVSLVMFALVLVFGNGSRRIYYKSNLIAGIVFPLVSIVFAIVVIVLNTSQISAINENLDLLRAVDTIVGAKGNISGQIVDIINSSSLSILTVILVDIFLAAFVGYAIFTVVYSVMRYTSCKEERESIIKKAVEVNE